MHQTATPRTGGAVTGRLTTNDRDHIEVAMINNTTPNREKTPSDPMNFTWRFLALSAAKPRIITIEAHSEQEARMLAPEGFVMVFVARIRNQLKWGVK